MPDLTPVEATAMAVWSTGSADSTQCLMAVRAAIRATRAEVHAETVRAVLDHIAGYNLGVACSVAIALGVPEPWRPSRGDPTT